MSRDCCKLHPAISWFQNNTVEQLHDYWAVACIKKTLIKHNWLWIVLTCFIILITNVTEVYWKQKLHSAIVRNWIVLKNLVNLIHSCCRSVSYRNLWVLLTEEFCFVFLFPSQQRKVWDCLVSARKYHWELDGKNILNLSELPFTWLALRSW